MRTFVVFLACLALITVYSFTDPFVMSNISPTKKRVKPFEAWLYEEVNIAFGLTRLPTLPILDEWQKASYPTDDTHRETIEAYRQTLLEYVDAWNEDELKYMFVSPFVRLVDFVSPNYKVFTQRPLTVTYENGALTTTGRVEFMLAEGIQIPRRPYFFLHEYKQENRRSNDPLGQLLIAMIAAQAANADEKPIYGCFVSGRSWFFVVLQAKTYAVSNAYNAASDDIFRIFAMLLEMKRIIDGSYKHL